MPDVANAGNSGRWPGQQAWKRGVGPKNPTLSVTEYVWRIIVNFLSGTKSGFDLVTDGKQALMELVLLVACCDVINERHKVLQGQLCHK